MAFKDRIKKYREARDLSQVALAEALGLSVGGIGGYENGSRLPKPEILAKLAEFFDVPVADLEHGPQLSGTQYAAFTARLSDALDHTSSDDFDALGISERAIRAAIRQKAPIREDRAVYLAEALGTQIDDILAMPPEESKENALQRLYDEHRVLFSALDSATPEELAKVEEYIKFLKTQR